MGQVGARRGPALGAMIGQQPIEATNNGGGNNQIPTAAAETPNNQPDQTANTQQGNQNQQQALTNNTEVAGVPQGNQSQNNQGSNNHGNSIAPSSNQIPTITADMVKNAYIYLPPARADRIAKAYEAQVGGAQNAENPTEVTNLNNQIDDLLKTYTGPNKTTPPSPKSCNNFRNN